MFSPTQIRRICIAIVCVMYSLSAFADRGADHRELHRKITLHYTFDSAEIDENLQENRNNLFSLKSILRDSVRIDSITIISHASPDGGYPHNIKLARERGLVLKNFILNECSDSVRLTSDRIILKDGAENWQGLTDMVDSRYSRHDREKVLRILADTSVGPETRKWRLKQLDGGYTWDYLYRHYMPSLRTSTVICIYVTLEEPEIRVLQEEAPVVVPQEPEQEPIPEPMPEPVPSPQQAPRTPIFALRSNLLVPLLNIGAEVPIGNRWSVSADYYFPWIWPSPKNKDCFELLGWSVEGRYWFGKDRTASDRLHGHSLGLYGAGGYYDFEQNYEGQQGEFVSTGLDYTYAMPIGRKKRVNLEVTIAVGYIHAWARNYNVHGEGGPLFKEEGDVLFDYFGPTKAAVSLVIPFYGKEGRK